MKKFAAYLLWFLLIAVLPLMACSNDGMTEAVADSFDVQFECPSLIEVAKGGEYTFQVTGSNKPAESDVIILESTGGISYTCVLVSVSENSFTIKLTDGCESGTYRVFIKRGDRKKQIGTTYINIVEGIDFTPDAGTTVYGVVSTADGPVQGVVVSDGVEVSVTDERGIYQLQSEKKWGYVFISVPSGYEVPAEGVLPQFYKMMKGDAATTERVDFSLTEVEGQDNYKVFMLGDMHLANRTGDLGQFMDFTEDLNSYRALHQHEKMYAITLGDMTWDLYWYSNSYALPEYLNTINNQVKGLQIFHTIGNHDYDYKATSDEEAGSRFMDYIAPTYYSFNIGKVHYVVLDDIDCSNYDGTTSRDYEKRVSAEQLSWLSKDLAYVDKSTPLVVVMHAQLFYPSQTEGFKIDHDVLNTTQLLDVLDGYKVHFVTGHTHLSFNVTPEDDVTGGREVYEHNAGAICASWWWSGYLTPTINRYATLSNNTSFYGSQYTFQGNGSIDDTIGYSGRHALACFPMKNPDGSWLYGTPYLNYKVGNGRHIMLGEGSHRNVNRTNDFSNTTRLVITPIKQLSLTGDFTYRLYQTRNTHRSNNLFYREYPDGPLLSYATGAGLNKLSESVNTRNYYSANVFANYEDTFGEAHHVTGVVGFNYERMYLKNVSAAGQNLTSTSLDDLDLVGQNAEGEVLTEVGGGQSEYALAGFFGRVNYDYKGRYLFEASGRYDGTSRFAAGSRWGFFPSGSVGWRISEEPFFKPLSGYVDNLKLRASFGSLGNQNVSSYYTYMRLISVSDFAGFTFGEGSSMAKYATLGAPVASDLTWETSQQWDFGFDLTMLKNRLNITVDGYVRNTLNMLTDGVELPLLRAAVYIAAGLSTISN